MPGTARMSALRSRKNGATSNPVAMPTMPATSPSPRFCDSRLNVTWRGVKPMAFRMPMSRNWDSTCPPTELARIRPDANSAKMLNTFRKMTSNWFESLMLSRTSVQVRP